MALFNIRFLIVFVSFSLGICLYFSSRAINIRECIMGNKEFVAVTIVAMVLATKIAFVHQKENLAKFKADDKRLAWIGLYIMTNTILTYFSLTIIDSTYRLVIQTVTGICFLSILFFPVSQEKKVLKYPKRKAIDYKGTTISSTLRNDLEQDNVVKIVKYATKCIALLDNLFLYKKSFQSMVDKFYEWTMLFSEQHKPQVYESLQPTEITLDKLICRLKYTLKEEMGGVPRLTIEKIGYATGLIPSKIVCNVSQVTRLLVTAVLRIANSDSLETEFLKLQLYTTYLQIDKSRSTNNREAFLNIYPAIALVLSNTNTPSDELPKVKSCYKHIPDSNIELIKRSKIIPSYIDPHKETIESIIDTQYGYLEYPKYNKNAILLVFPMDIETICKQKITQSHTKHLKTEVPITLEEEADSMIMLMQFYDFTCRSFKKINPEVFGGTLLLLKKRFGVKEHASGKLFYIRAVGITKIITKWIFHTPEPIYVCLLYDLVRYTNLPLSYIKENYNSTVHTLIQDVLNTDTHQAIESSLPKVTHHFKKGADQDHPELFVLCIKLAERLYDLRHAENYTHLSEVKNMTQETLTIGIKLAEKYLDPEITKALEVALKNAEAYLKNKE